MTRRRPRRVEERTTPPAGHDPLRVRQTRPTRREPVDVQPSAGREPSEARSARSNRDVDVGEAAAPSAGAAAHRPASAPRPGSRWGALRARWPGAPDVPVNAEVHDGADGADGEQDEELAAPAAPSAGSRGAPGRSARRSRPGEARIARRRARRKVRRSASGVNSWAKVNWPGRTAQGAGDRPVVPPTDAKAVASQGSEPLYGPPEPGPGPNAGQGPVRGRERDRSVPPGRRFDADRAADRGDGRAGEPQDAASADVGPVDESRRPRLVEADEPRRLPLFGLRQLGMVVRAVYVALAEPITSADDEARELRAARLRRAGLVAGSAVMGVLMVYSIFPVREFLDQREAQARQTERRDVLIEANERQEEYRDWLESEEGIEWRARQHGFTYPGEEPINVLPAPEE